MYIQNVETIFGKSNYTKQYKPEHVKQSANFPYF